MLERTMMSILELEGKVQINEKTEKMCQAIVLLRTHAGDGVFRVRRGFVEDFGMDMERHGRGSAGKNGRYCVDVPSDRRCRVARIFGAFRY